MPTNQVTLPTGQTITLPQAYEDNEAKRIAFDYARANGLLGDLPEEDTSDVLPSVERGTRQIGSMLATTGSEIAGAVGFTGIEEALDDFAADQRDQIDPRRIESYKEGLSSVGSSVDYAQQAIAEATPSMAFIGAASGTGAAIGSAGGPVGTAVGALIGGLIGGVSLSFGEIRQGVEEIDPDSEVSSTELIGAIAVGALDAVSAGVIFKPLLGRYIKSFGKEAVVEQLVREGLGRAAARNMIQAAGKGILVEAPTEAAQEAIEAFSVAGATDTEVDLETLGNNMIEAALTGGIAGGFFGGMSSGVASVTDIVGKGGDTVRPSITESTSVSDQVEALETPVAEQPESVTGASQTVGQVAKASEEVGPVVQENIPNLLDNSPEAITERSINNILTYLRDQGVSKQELDARAPLFEAIANKLVNKQIGTSSELNPELEPVISAAEEGIIVTRPEDINVELDARRRLDDSNASRRAIEGTTVGNRRDPLGEAKQERLDTFVPNKNPVKEEALQQTIDDNIANLSNPAIAKEAKPVADRIYSILEEITPGTVIDPLFVQEKLSDPSVNVDDIATVINGFATEEVAGQPIVEANQESGTFVRTPANPQVSFQNDTRGIPQQELPVIIQDKLRGLVTPKTELTNPKLFEDIEKRVRKVTGNGPSLQFAEDLQDIYGNPKRGAQIGNLMFVSYNINNPNIEETALHEAYHFLRQNNALSAADERLLVKETPRIQKILSEEYGLDVRDLENLGPLGQEELQAELFGKYVTNPKTKVGPLKKVFDKLIRILRQIYNGLRGAGFRTFEDLFNEINAGQRNPSTQGGKQAQEKVSFQGSLVTTASKQFKNWFKNSKVVDAQGNPLVVYHGTSRSFESFDMSKRGSQTGNFGDTPLGMFFSNKPSVASTFSMLLGVSSKKGNNVLPVYLSLQKPVVLDFKGAKYTASTISTLLHNTLKEDPGTFANSYGLGLNGEKAKSVLIERGYDGVILRNATFGEITPAMQRTIGGPIGEYDTYIIFKPPQVKSVHNQGTFDPQDPRILFQEQRAPADIIADAVDASAAARFQEITEEWYDSNPDLDEIHAVYSQPIVEDIPTDALNQAFTPIQRYTKGLMSAPQIATFSPMHAATVNHFIERKQDMSALMTRFENNLRPYLQDEKKFEALSSILDHLSSTEQNFKIDKEGRLRYTNKRGVDVFLPKDVTGEVLGLQEVFKEVPRAIDESVRGMFSEEFPELTTAAPEVFRQEALKIKDGLAAAVEPSEIEMIRQKASLLEDAATNLEEIATVLDASNSYFPQMRFGEYGIVIPNNNKGGKKFFASIDRGVLDTFDKKQFKETIDQINADPKLSAQYDTSKVKPFRMTYNSISKRIDERMITPELVGSLLGTGSKEYKKVAEKLRDRVGLSELQKHFRQRENLPGYSRDYERVSAAYLSNAARYITNIKYSNGAAKLDAQIDSLQDTAISDDVRKYFDYNNDPMQDMVGLRTFNFMYTMGVNFSTAALQLVTLPTTSVSLMMQWAANPIRNNGLIAKNFGVAARIVGRELRAKGKVDVTETFSREEMKRRVAKGELTADKAALFMVAGRRNVLDPNLMNESLGGSEFSTSAFKRRAGKVTDVVGRTLGMPIAAAEQASRISSLGAFYDSLSTPRIIEKAKKAYTNDARFQSAYQRNQNAGATKLDDRQFISIYALEEAHGIFGKEGRGIAQRGLLGSVVFPFMTHPIQMVELLARQATQRGGAGKAAVAYNVMTYITLAGLMGIPGMELMKELTEFLIGISTGVNTDLFNDITLALRDAGYDPQVAEFVRGGATRAFLDMDVARRINLPVFFQSPLIALMEGDVELRDIAGVGGQVVQAVTESRDLVAQGNYGQIARSILPVALKNALKGAYDLNPYLGDGISTKTGVRLINPEEADFHDSILQSFGIAPGKIASRREALYEQNLQTYGYRTGEEKYRSTMTRLFEELQGVRDTNPERAAEIRKEIKEERQGLIAFRIKNGLPVDSRFWAGFNRGIMGRVRQRTHPDALQSNRRHIDRRRIEEAFGSNFDEDSR